ncbi:MAG TPA: hypothetical protein VMV69_26220 [Pirellulales bacterium]|nr:hypothetical protein [Pirellulales bacterium]
MEDPLDYIDFADVIVHGDPSNWRYKGPKPGSPTPATSPNAQPGTMKHYDMYVDEHGDEIEVHFFRRPDGSVGDVKIK